MHFLTCSVAERGFAVHEKPSRDRARGEAVHGGKMALAHGGYFVTEGRVAFFREPCRAYELVGDSRKRGNDHDGRLSAGSYDILDFEYGFWRSHGGAAEFENFHLRLLVCSLQK